MRFVIKPAYFVRRLVNALTLVLGILAGVSVVIMMLIVCYEVVMRYVFRAPTVWSVEISGYLLVLITFFAAALGLREGSHVSIDILVLRLRRKARLRLNIAIYLICLVYSALLVWYGWEMAMRSYHLHEVASSLLATPMVIPELFIPIGAGVLSLLCLVLVFHNVGLLRGDK